MTGLLDNLARVQPPAELPDSAIAADEELVAEAVVRIRQLLAKTVQRGLEEVGQFLLDQFYDGSTEAYMSTSAYKHVSLRLLMDRCGTVELPVTKSWLARSIRMAALTRQLPRTSRFLALPASHRVELMKVKSILRIEALAVRTFEEKLTVQRLRELVEDEVERGKSTRGRKPIPKVLRALRQCVKQVRDELTGKLVLHREDVDELDGRQAQAAREAADYLHKRMEELMKLLDSSAVRARGTLPALREPRVTAGRPCSHRPGGRNA